MLRRPLVSAQGFIAVEGSELHRDGRQPCGIRVEERSQDGNIRQVAEVTVELLALAHDRGCERELAEQLAETLDALQACLSGSRSISTSKVLRYSCCGKSLSRYRRD